MADINARDYAISATNEGIPAALMDAPGYSDTLIMYGCWDSNIAYTIALINTNVVVQLEGSNNNSDWFSLSEEITKTANGTYNIHHQERVNYMRLRWISELGGTVATIQVNFSPGVRS